MVLNTGKISRGCKPFDECIFATTSPGLPGFCNPSAGGVSCVLCDYFPDDSGEDKPWFKCEEGGLDKPYFVLYGNVS